MPTKYVLSAINGDHIDAKPTKLLNKRSYKRTNSKLKIMLEKISGTKYCGVNKNTQKRSFNLEIMFFSFPRGKKRIWANLRKDGLDHLGHNIAYLTT
jgi:hypothetical protein